MNELLIYGGASFAFAAGYAFRAYFSRPSDEGYWEAIAERKEKLATESWNCFVDACRECNAIEGSRAQFDVRFYLVAILFIIFDLEAAFLFPWAVSLKHIGWAGWAAMMIFLAELVLGLVYAWKKGALEWE